VSGLTDVLLVPSLTPNFVKESRATVATGLTSLGFLFGEYIKVAMYVPKFASPLKYLLGA
jgi:hypothetical protein